MKIAIFRIKKFRFLPKKMRDFFLHHQQDLSMTRPQSKTGGRETPISARYERLKLAELTPSRSQRGEQLRGIALFEALSRLLEYPRVTSDSCQLLVLVPFQKNVFHCFTLPGSEGGRRGSWGGSGVRTLRAPCFEFAIFGNFCKRTLHLVLQYSTGRNSASGAKNKTQKFVDTEENGSKEVLHYVFLIKNRIYYHSYLAEIGVWRPPVFD